MNMDTDSSYFVSASEDFMDIVKPEQKHKLLMEYGNWFVEPFCAEHRREFVEHHTSNKATAWQQRACCKKHEIWDNRTPGKFKREFTGTAMVALNAKTYICVDAVDTNHPDKVKLSSKGVSKATNNLTYQQYKDVLYDKSSIYGENVGFLRRNNITFTAQQRKRALTYFYGKRKVSPNGVSTSHLDL